MRNWKTERAHYAFADPVRSSSKRGRKEKDRALQPAASLPQVANSSWSDSDASLKYFGVGKART